MGKYIALGLITAILALTALYAFDPSYRAERESAALASSQREQLAISTKATQTALDLQQQQLTAQIDAQRSQAIAPVTIGLAIGGYIFFGIVAGLGVLAGGMFCIVFLARRAMLVRPDAQGILPMPLVGFDRLAQSAGATLGAFHLGRIEQARHQPGQQPHSISTSTHYAPQFRNEQRGTLEGPAGLPLLELDQVLGVPTFAQLLDQGRIGRGQPLLLGVDEQGEEIAGSWLDLYSTIVSGLPGSGKTTSQRFLACQTALQGARFVIVDPHAGAADDSLAATLQPLSSAFLCAPASDDKAILNAVQLVADIGERRVKGKDSSTWPVILWLDETTKLLSRSTVAGPLATLLEGIAQEYRKKNVFACASGQIWSASRTGDDSALRDSFASVLCHRMKRSQARLLIPTEEAQTVERLGTGQAVLWRTSGETSVISVPNTTAQDVVRVAGLLAGPTRQDAPDQALLADLLIDKATARPRPSAGPGVDASTAQTRPSAGPGADVSTDDTATASESEILASPELTRIVELFKSGANVHTIVAQVYEETNPGARAYKQARAQVEAMLRAALSSAG